jgi:hypothetical protein
MDRVDGGFRADRESVEMLMGGGAMNRKLMRKKMALAEKMEAKWDRTLFVAIHKVREYRRRAKYYQERLEAMDHADLQEGERITRKIRIALDATEKERHK